MQASFSSRFFRQTWPWAWLICWLIQSPSTPLQAAPPEPGITAPDPAAPAKTEGENRKAETFQPPLKQIGPGLFELGGVRLDKAQRAISFPAVLNMNTNLIEYLIVTTFGKTHESLLRTEVAPYQIQVALLLLGARGAGTNDFPENHARPLPGDKVGIELSWKVDGNTKLRRAEECVRNRQTQSPASTGPWIYNGSRMVEGVFIAQELGSIVSLIEDTDALINNPRPGRDNDEIWEIKSEGLPPLNSPVQVTIKLER
jgi:hypothetical protein